MDRRRYLSAIGVATVTALAGCGSGEPDDGASPTTTEPPAETTETTAATDGPTETDTPQATETETDTPDQTETATPSDAAQTVVVAPGGNLDFEPETFELSAGDTVVWTWNGNGHNVVPNEIPDDADWSGTEGGEGTTYDEGHVYEHTFTTAGEYSYYCAPHRSAGMTGSFTVV